MTGKTARELWLPSASSAEGIRCQGIAYSGVRGEWSGRSVVAASRAIHTDFPLRTERRRTGATAVPKITVEYMISRSTRRHRLGFCPICRACQCTYPPRRYPLPDCEGRESQVGIEGRLEAMQRMAIDLANNRQLHGAYYSAPKMY